MDAPEGATVDREISPSRRCCDEERSDPRRIDLLLPRSVGKPAGIAGDTRRQHDLRLGIAAVRSGNRRMTAPIERQTELVLEQMKRCLEAAAASFDNVMKCNIYCTSARLFQAVN